MTGFSFKSHCQGSLHQEGNVQQRLEGGEGVGCVDFWGRNFPGRISPSEQSLIQVCSSSCCRLSERDGDGNVTRGTT